MTKRYFFLIVTAMISVVACSKGTEYPSIDRQHPANDVVAAALPPSGNSPDIRSSSENGTVDNGSGRSFSDAQKPAGRPAMASRATEERIFQTRRRGALTAEELSETAWLDRAHHANRAAAAESVSAVEANDIKQAAAAAEAAAIAAYPIFPWPPPRASAQALLSRKYFSKDRTFIDVESRLAAALSAIGLSEMSLYSAGGDSTGRGFVLISRIERMYPDGRSWPLPGRFAFDDTRDFGQGVPFTLGAYLHALFAAPTGRYRVIAFVVTDRPIVQSHTGMTEKQSEMILGNGADSLPAKLGAQPFTATSKVTSLIYEFERRQGGGAVEVPQSRVPAVDQLSKAGFIQALGG